MSDLVALLRSLECKAGCGTMDVCVCSYAGDAADEIEQLAAEKEKWQDAEIRLSAAYVRLRNLIPGALDTPRAPSSEQVWDITEQAVGRLVAAARYYYEHFLQDEADDMECCLSEDQHRAAKALRDALNFPQGQQT